MSQSMATVHHLPGRVATPNSSVPLEFNFSGNPRAERKSVSKRFKDELTDLLRSAGYAGTFNLVLGQYVKGTSHTKGLRIKSPTVHGIELTWHEGSNDNCLSMILCVPRHENVEHFHAKLKQALTSAPAAKDEDVAEEGMRMTTIESASKSSDPGGNEPDQTLVELFVEEVVKQIDAFGSASRQVCLDVIEQFGVAKEMANATLSSLVQYGHLAANGDDAFELGAPWRDKFKKTTVSEPVLQSTPSVTTSSVGGAMEAYRALEAKVAGASTIRAKLARLRAKSDVLKREYEAVRAEFSSAKAELDALAEDEQKLALIRQMLGIL